MTESFDEEENEFRDGFEYHKVRNGTLENGHRKHLKKPRNSLHEFERMENLCNLQNGHTQSADDEGIFNGYEQHPENDRSISMDSQDHSESSFGGSTFDKEELRRIEKVADMSHNNSRENGSMVGNGHWNNGYGAGDGSDVQTLSDGAPPDEDQDPSSEIIMQKYMEETPRRISSGIPSSPHFSDALTDSPGHSPSHGQVFDIESNTNSNNNKGVPLDDRLEDITNISRKSDGLFSLSQEQPPSHLEELDGDEGDTDEQSELIETAIPGGLEEAIQRAAQNVQEFGSETEDRHSERQSESSISVGKFKSVAVSGHKRKKSRGSSSRSSQDGSSRSRHRHSPDTPVNESEASIIAGEEGHVGSEDLGDPGLHAKEESPLKQRLSSRIPALNLQDMTDTESDPDNPTPRSKEELSSRLSEERKTRRQTTKVVEQLQLDYDELLAKYAQAENTIDQLRLGAKVNLYSDPPPRGQSSGGSLIPAKQPQRFELATPQRAESSRAANSRGVTASSAVGPSAGGVEEVPGEDTLTSQRVSHDMRLTVANLAQQIPLLERAIDSNQVPAAEQQELFNQLKQTHGQLEEEYMQRMEEAKEQQRWSSVLPDFSVEQFDPEKSLEGKIFQVGMQLEDLQEKVEENIRKNPPEISTPSRHSTSRRQSFHQDIPKEEVIRPQLPPEYIQLLQKYETLKQLPANPKRDQEIQKLVKEIDNLQVSPTDEGNYMSERSEVSSSSRRRSIKRKERAASSGRGTPSSARSLERQKSVSDEEVLSRNTKKTVEPISIPRKTAGIPGDSGSSHPRSPEHEIDSGFVGSEGSRQSQQSKQKYIPSSRTTSGSHWTHSEPGTHKTGAKIKSIPHHTPIQELSERGQQSSSQSESRRRSGHSQKPKPVSTSSEEEEEETYKKGSLERPTRTHRRSATPSSHHSSRHQQVHSPLPSKPKVEDFQRRSLFSPPKKSLPSQKSVSSSKPSKPVRLEGQGPKRNTEPKSSSPSKTKVDPRIERLRRRRDSDIGSSGSKSVRSEEVLALQREVAALKQHLHPSVGRNSLQSRSVISEENEDRETEGASEDDGYVVGRSHDGYEMNSVKSSRSSKSERLAELRAEMDQLKEDLLHPRETGRRSQRKLAPSATSTPAFERGRRSKKFPDLEEEYEVYPSPVRDRVESVKGRDVSEKLRNRHNFPDWEEDYEVYPSPTRGRTEPVKERDLLRETLRRKYIPTSKSPRPVRSSKEYPSDRLSSTEQDLLGFQRQREKDLIRPSELKYNANNTLGYPRTGHDHSKADPVFNPLSSLETSPRVVHQKSSSQQTMTNPFTCQHCNGSGINHNHPETGQRFTHQSPTMQQAPTTFVQPSPTTFVQPPSNTTVFVPNGNPVYHSTPNVLHTPGAATMLQGPLVSQVPLSTITQQQASPGTVIGGTTMVPPQGNVTYAAIPSTVPVTMLSPSPQVKVPQQVISVSPQEQSTTTHGAAANGARPVYLVPSSKGRYYIRDNPAVEDSDVEEIIYRRTPVKRTPRRKSKQVEFHSQVHLEESDLDETLYAAYQMAQRLKRSSEKVLESAQDSLQKAGLRKQLDFF